MICVWLLFCSLIINQNNYVSLYPGTVTRYDEKVFLAHEYADGKYFKEIAIGDEIFYNSDRYIVTEILETEMNPVTIYPDKLMLITCHNEGRLIIYAIPIIRNPGRITTSD